MSIKGFSTFTVLVLSIFLFSGVLQNSNHFCELNETNTSASVEIEIEEEVYDSSAQLSEPSRDLNSSQFYIISSYQFYYFIYNEVHTPPPELV